MKALLIAEAANPEFISVPLVGWSLYKALAQECEVHLVTQVRNREAILRTGAEESSFTWIDTEALAIPAYRLGTLLGARGNKAWTVRTALSSLIYPYFEHLVWRRFGGRIRSKEFDVVHRITPLSPTAPSLVAKRCRRAGIPFVLGPLNGGLPWPPGFGRQRRLEREWLSHLRSAYKLLPGYRSTLNSSAAILVGSRATRDQLPPRHLRKCAYIPENGIDTERFSLKRTGAAHTPLRVAFVGRLVPYKGADILLEAAAPLVRRGRAEVTIVGDGPERADLESFVAREGLAHGVKILGWVAHERVQDYLAEADVFVFPSIREFGGGVVLEAMALGLAPIVVDYGGPGELVTSSCGVRVPLGSREEIVAGFNQALTRISEDPQVIEHMACSARERVTRHFTWAAKAKQVAQVYEWVTGKRSVMPDFGCPIGDQGASACEEGDS